MLFLGSPWYNKYSIVGASEEIWSVDPHQDAILDPLWRGGGGGVTATAENTEILLETTTGTGIFKWIFLD